MNRIFVLIFSISVFLVSCGQGAGTSLGNASGELVGTGRVQELQEYPFGMVYVPSGVFTMGSSEQDPTGISLSNVKTVSLSGFFMDDSEITNDEYRQFTNWVKDSILRERLAVKAEEIIKKRGIQEPNDLESEVDDAETDEGDDDEESEEGDEEEAAEEEFEGDEESIDDEVAPSDEDLENSSVADIPASQKTEPITPQELEQGILRYRYARVDTAVNKYYGLAYKKYNEQEIELARLGFGLDWDVELVWDITNIFDLDYAEVLEGLYKPLVETITKGGRELENDHFVYKYYNNGKLVNALVKIDSLEEKEELTFEEQIQKETILSKVFPNEKVWLRDFAYSFNDPVYNQYFTHVTYDNYPIVGITWSQSLAFADWRTAIRNDYLQASGRPTINDYRLPTEAEWEYAARGGLPSSKYPWGGPYAYDQTGCFMANFKPRRGDYLSDGSLYAAPVKQYDPNPFGLYDMSGNVSEWTGTSYHPSAYMFESTMNPNFFDPEAQTIVIRGGSWKDIAYYLQVSTKDYQHKDSTTSYTGFRTVLDFVDESNFDQF